MNNMNYLNKSLLLIFLLLLTFGCHQIPSTDKLKSDINSLQEQIKNAEDQASQYAGLYKTLIQIRVAILKNTLAALEQKNTGYKRFIPITYTIDGKESSLKDKEAQLKELSKSISQTKKEIADAEVEENRYTGGLLKVLAMTRKATGQSTLAFLEQKRLLLVHDIPISTVMPDLKSSTDDTSKGDKFQISPGTDQDNL